MLSLITATSVDGVIGVNGKIPWRYPEDMVYFRARTSGKIVVMGRRTFEEIGRPLQHRLNIVLTRQKEESRFLSGMLWMNSFEAVLAHLAKYEDEENFIIGGAEIYHLFLPHVERIYHTRIPLSYHDHPGVKTYFPDWNTHQGDFTSLGFTLTECLAVASGVVFSRYECIPKERPREDSPIMTTDP